MTIGIRELEPAGSVARLDDIEVLVLEDHPQHRVQICVVLDHQDPSGNGIDDAPPAPGPQRTTHAADVARPD